MPRRVFSCARRGRGRPAGFSCLQKKQENTEEIKAMPFQKGQSGNPAGRPGGLVNRATALAQNLLSERAEGIARKVIALAEEGDMAAIRVCMERLVPRIKHQPVAVELPPLEKAVDSVEALASIAAAVAAGGPPPAGGRQLAQGGRGGGGGGPRQGLREAPVGAGEGEQHHAGSAGACRGPRRPQCLRPAPTPPPRAPPHGKTTAGRRKPLFLIDPNNGSRNSSAFRSL